jgi:hypothetical protein
LKRKYHTNDTRFWYKFNWLLVVFQNQRNWLCRNIFTCYWNRISKITMIAFVALYNVIHVHRMDMEANVLWCNLKWEMCLLQIGSTKELVCESFPNFLSKIKKFSLLSRTHQQPTTPFYSATQTSSKRRKQTTHGANHYQVCHTRMFWVMGQLSL